MKPFISETDKLTCRQSKFYSTYNNLAIFGRNEKKIKELTAEMCQIWQSLKRIEQMYLLSASCNGKYDIQLPLHSHTHCSVVISNIQLYEQIVVLDSVEMLVNCDSLTVIL